MRRKHKYLLYLIQRKFFRFLIEIGKKTSRKAHLIKNKEHVAEIYLLDISNKIALQTKTTSIEEEINKIEIILSWLDQSLSKNTIQEFYLKIKNDKYNVNNSEVLHNKKKILWNTILSILSTNKLSTFIKLLKIITDEEIDYFLSEPQDLIKKREYLVFALKNIEWNFEKLSISKSNIEHLIKSLKDRKNMLLKLKNFLLLLFWSYISGIMPGYSNWEDEKTSKPSSYKLGNKSAFIQGYYLVNVYYATDRNLIENYEKIIFGSMRADKEDNSTTTLNYGTCKISIPYKHKLGELESPSFYKMEIVNKPNKHVTVLNVSISSKENFFSKLNRMSSSGSLENAFLFVHGYNVSFMDAARRTAQIHYDLKFDGAPIFYSWPSKGNVIRYISDEATIEWSKNNLEDFIEQIFQSSSVKQLFLIGHSMGSRALTRAITSLLIKNPTYGNKIKEIILAAPDIDAGVFKNEIVPIFAKHLQSVTLYASSKDQALRVSKLVHGYDRAGQSGEKLLISHHVETIDATLASTSLYKLNHSYFSNTRTILSDISYIINQGLRAKQRFGLDKVEGKAGHYWKMRK